MKGIPIYTSDAARVAGVVKDRRFVTTRRASIHQLRIPPAWCFDRDVLERARQHGAKLVVVREVEQENVFEADLEIVLRDGFSVDRGFGCQVGLPLSRWRINGQPSEHERRAAATERREITLPRDDYALTELENYSSHRRADGSYEYSAPAGLHDDCVMAIAWAFERGAESSGRAVEVW